MKKLLFLFFIPFALSFGQPFHKQAYTQTIILPGDSVSSVYFLCKIPYQNLVFIKDDSLYTAGFRLYLEITDTNSNFVRREIKDWQLQANSFEETNSPDVFAEGLIKIKLSKGSYNILPIITDKNATEIRLKKVRVDISNKKYIASLIVDSKKIKCSDQNFIHITNFGDSLPFGKEECDFLIPVTDTSKNEISVTVVSKKDTVYSGELNKSFVSNINLFECNGNVLISDKNEGIKTRNYILAGISEKIPEGPFFIIIDNGKDAKFKKDVLWYDKPFSLKDPEAAIKALKSIEKEDVVDSLLDLKKDLMYKGLVDYWKKLDPTPETQYNELMTEFYMRVDYTLKNFSTISGVKGVQSDRGKVFIKYGKPDKIERSSNLQGKVVETWIYDKLHRKFVFVDEDGTGEFSLESS